jgi:hypothetical protein
MGGLHNLYNSQIDVIAEGGTRSTFPSAAMAATAAVVVVACARL